MNKCRHANGPVIILSIPLLPTTHESRRISLTLLHSLIFYEKCLFFSLFCKKTKWRLVIECFVWVEPNKILTSYNYYYVFIIRPSIDLCNSMHAGTGRCTKRNFVFKVHVLLGKARALRKISSDRSFYIEWHPVLVFCSRLLYDYTFW